ncbi:MAG: pantoate--beta-alanine ligase, partial [Ilumatobacteraceae bacterium]
AWSSAHRSAGRSVGLVPTMGALHQGHRALIGDMRNRSDVVVVSIFVNPLQFNESADFDSYPRPIERDADICRELGVDGVYAPTAATMYPPDFATGISVHGLTSTMEGAMRPGHFDGVATVVTKLFTAVQPDRAAFGEKDYQQLAIIRRMTADLDLGVEIVAHPIVREPDGLALSSRNVRLSPDARAAAVCVPRSLDAAVERAIQPAATVADVAAAAATVIDAEPLAVAEYVTVFDPDTLDTMDGEGLIAGHQPGSARIATAVRFGDVRLIDNRSL